MENKSYLTSKSKSQIIFSEAIRMSDKLPGGKRSGNDNSSSSQPPAKVLKAFLFFYLAVIMFCPVMVAGQKILFSPKMIPIHCSRVIASDQSVVNNIKQLISLISAHSKDTDNEDIGAAIISSLENRLELFLHDSNDPIYMESESIVERSLDFLSSALKFFIGTPSASDWTGQIEINSHLLSLQKK